jgi:hypothetical protein
LKVAQHGVSCTVVPVSSRNGCVVGFIDLVGPAWAVNTEMLRLVDRAAKDASIKIDQGYRERLRQLRQWAQEHLDPARYAGGALVIDTKGWVAHADRWEHDDRIAAPDGGFRLGLHEVEGLGWIVLEPLWGGWLVRRPGQGEDQPRVRVVLDLRISSKENDRAGWILVNGPTVSWRHVLSRGTAEILLMLTESGGHTYRELENDLYSRMTGAQHSPVEVEQAAQHARWPAGQRQQPPVREERDHSAGGIPAGQSRPFARRHCSRRRTVQAATLRRSRWPLLGNHWQWRLTRS